VAADRDAGDGVPDRPRPAMRRVSVTGVMGSGKTTFGRRLARVLHVPFLELDSIFHQPGWTELPRDEFRAQVSEVVSGDGWVVDGNYGAVRDLVWAAADTVVFLDPSRAAAMRRVVARTLRRGLTRTELWNGNRESLRNVLRVDPGENIILDTWRVHPEMRRRFASARVDPTWAHLRFVRAARDDEVRALLGGAERERS